MALSVQRVRSESAAMAHSVLPRFRVANFVSRLLPPLSASTVRAALYRKAGFRIAPQVAFLGSITVIGTGPHVCGNLRIGRGSLIGLDPLFNLDDRITIGERVSLGPSVKIYTSTHLLGPGSRRMSPAVVTKPVEIGDGAWIGVGAIILPGVRIGSGAVVSAGTVVSKDVPANTLFATTGCGSVEELPWGDE